MNEEVKRDTNAIDESVTTDIPPEQKQSTVQDPEPLQAPKSRKFSGFFKTHRKMVLLNGIYIIIICALVAGLLYTIIPKTDADKRWAELSDSGRAQTFDVYDKFRTIDWNIESAKKEQQRIVDDYKATEEEKFTIQAEIKDLEAEKKRLEGDILKKKAEPKTIPAGEFTAGTDFDAGRYVISNGSSNFVVHSATGELQVNIILGGGSYGVDTYTYSFQSGDKVRASSAFTLTPVE